MSALNGHKPAFPVHPSVHEKTDMEADVLSGMDLRDYFAAKAMAALICEPPFGDGNTTVFAWTKNDVVQGVDRFALAAYRMADAMMRASEAKS